MAESISTEDERDVVVAGAGMGGLVTAVEAAERDADVLVIEKAPKPGGSMAMSDGFLWTHASYECAREVAPDGDSELQRLVVNRIEAGHEWIEERGVELESPPFETDDGRLIDPPLEGVSKRMDPAAFTETMVDRIRDEGGEVKLETPLVDIETDDHGHVSTATIAPANEDRQTVCSGCVVLATGGFQGNEALVQQFITDNVENLWLRANPHSTGDGLMIGRDLGARLTKGMGTFYGHNLVAPPAEVSASDFVSATQYYGPLGIALNSDGRRFTDERELPFEYTLSQDTVDTSNGRAYLVIDADIYDVELSVPISETVEQAREFGGRVAEAQSFDAVRTVLQKWGVDGKTAVETIRAYNDAVRSDGDSPYPPKSADATPIDTPPFHIVEIQAGITFTMGGLSVTPSMEVVAEATSNSTLYTYKTNDEVPLEGVIPGLYAAGVDIGNISNRGYVGGLAQSLVTGLIAGRQASSYSRR